MLAKVVATTLSAQAAVVLASLTLPVLAGRVGPELGVPTHLVGFYGALISVSGMAAALLAPTLVQRHGAIRVHQAMLVLAAAGLA